MKSENKGEKDRKGSEMYLLLVLRCYKAFILPFILHSLEHVPDVFLVMFFVTKALMEFN